MKKLTLRLVLPLTIITFFVFTRWECAEVVDAPNSVLHGFPLLYDCPDWGSSMALQFFVTEFVMDILAYFVFFFIVIYLVDRFAFNIKLPKPMFITLYIIAGLILSMQVLIYSVDTTFYLHRSFDIKVIKSTYGFFWQNHPDCF
jgi:hypothetical protein